MKFNPITKDIFTDNDEFVKRMHCPYKMSWEGMEGTNSTLRTCSHCDHSVFDTEKLTDSELVTLVKSNTNSCLKLDLNQSNLKITLHEHLEEN